MQMVLDSLGAPDSFDVRSGEISPLAGITEPRIVPVGVENPISWVASAVLPQFGESEQDLREIAHRQSRDKLGYRFFEQWNVSMYVQRKFRPELLPVRNSSRLPQVKHDISHFVSGPSELLLMEPIIGTRARLVDDLKGISESFLAYRSLFEMSRTERQTSFIVYVLSRGYGGAVSEAHEVLKGAATQIVNVDDPSQRIHFLQRITDIGRSGGNQGALQLQ
ncbi:MAG: hypothetical protein JXB05_25375 [Myxococcaceae bacterium]|nr:hypothetical protein [Myxococcaceae bacterium]